MVHTHIVLIHIIFTFGLGRSNKLTVTQYLFRKWDIYFLGSHVLPLDLTSHLLCSYSDLDVVMFLHSLTMYVLIYENI